MEECHHDSPTLFLHDWFSIFSGTWSFRCFHCHIQCDNWLITGGVLQHLLAGYKWWSISTCMAETPLILQVNQISGTFFLQALLDLDPICCYNSCHYVRSDQILNRRDRHNGLRWAHSRLMALSPIMGFKFMLGGNIRANQWYKDAYMVFSTVRDCFPHHHRNSSIFHSRELRWFGEELPDYHQLQFQILGSCADKLGNSLHGEAIPGHNPLLMVRNRSLETTPNKILWRRKQTHEGKFDSLIWYMLAWIKNNI